MTTAEAERRHRARPAGSGASARGDGDRKAQVHSRHTPSSVSSIADAVVIKDGEPFFICPQDGQIRISGHHGFGLYHHDARFLSGYELTVAGVEPSPLAATSITGNRGIVELTTAKIDLAPGRTIAKDRLAIRWTRELDGQRARLTDRIALRNFESKPAHLPLQLRFASAFEDVYEVRGLVDVRRGTVRSPAWQDGRLVLGYDGADGIRRTLTISSEPPPTRRDGTSFEVDLDLDARGSAEVTVELQIDETPEPGVSPIEPRTDREPGAGHRDAGETAATGAAGATGVTAEGPARGDGWPLTVDSDSFTLNGALARSLDDLLTLRGTLDGQRYYAAGVPWFSTLFGRDSLISAYQTLAFDSSLAAETLRLLARRQGTHDDDFREEQPGKIMHELRIGELARLGEIPDTPYYGSIDSTPLFLLVLARHAAWTGSPSLFRELRDPVERALAWIDRHVAADRRGYLAYESDEGQGLANQGWKDSGDAIVRQDGGLAHPPIALPEVQGYVYAARRELANLFAADGDDERAERLRREARELRDRFERDFWSDDLGCYVLALDRDGPCEVATSNAGQVLWSGIASREHAERVAERLLRPDLFAGWGIRTLSSDATAFNPIGYHLGTVWPHDNGLIAEGFRRYGLTRAVETIAAALIEASTHFPDQRLPECFSGFARSEFGMPVRYPVACHPQAWAAGAVPHLVTSMLGLVPLAFEHRLAVLRPRLPGFMRHLELHGLRVGSARVDLAFDSNDGPTTARVLGVDGDLDVRIEAER